MEIEKKDLCIVHIGMPKTGSSTLQEAFFNGINDARVSYIHLSEFNQGCILYGMFMNNPEKFHYFASRGWKSQQIEEFSSVNKDLLINGFSKLETSIEILSGEDLYHFSESAVKKLKEFLDPYFKKILIVGYVRPVKSFLESAFQQLVKYHELDSLDFTKIYHPYKNFERYDKVFGQENVLLLKFDPRKFPEGDILLDFCTKLNLTASKSNLKTINESLSQEAIAILFTYHFHKNCKTDFGSKKYQINNKLVEEIRNIGSTRFRFSGKYMKSIMENYFEDYSWIKERMHDEFDENIDFNSEDSISSQHELMVYSTNCIEDLIVLVRDVNITFNIEKNPQSVAKLVDLLMNKLSNELQ